MELMMAEHDNFCENILTGNCKPFDKKNDHVTLSRDTSCDKFYRSTNRISDKSLRLDNLRRALPGITETRPLITNLEKFSLRNILIWKHFYLEIF